VPITVVVIDDHTPTLANVLRRQDEIDLVGLANNVDDGARVVARMRPDVVVVDLRERNHNGPLITERILAADPDVAVVVRSATDRVDTIVDTVRAAAAGDDALDPHALAKALRRMNRDRLAGRLSPRELEVLSALARGLSTEAVASELGLSPHTVRNHVRAICSKLGAISRSEAVAVATRAGIVLEPDA
jgi:DNA-binding NarL/FixJ family response regulator